MKRIIAIALVAFASLSTAVGAGEVPTKAQIGEIRHYAKDVDVSNLSVTDVIVLLNIIHGGNSEGEKRMLVKAHLQ